MKPKLASLAAFVVIIGVGTSPAIGQPALADLLDRATRYVLDYEQVFTVLVADEEYVQWIERPTNPGTNLNRANPGGGMIGGGQRQIVTVKSDFVLVQLGEGQGWMPFRDVFAVNGRETRHQEDRLAKLFLSNNPDAFELATRIHSESKRHDLGNVARTINIPTLAMAFLHPRVRERFSFKLAGEEVVGARTVERVNFRETTRPTLIKTSRGRDLGLEGTLWIDSSTGTIVKTAMIAADPAVRAQVTVTFRRDPQLGFWVPELMEEYYKANLALDDVFAKATYTNHRSYDGK
jgi:hypothetical protein